MSQPMRTSKAAATHPEMIFTLDGNATHLSPIFFKKADMKSTFVHDASSRRRFDTAQSSCIFSMDSDTSTGRFIRQLHAISKLISEAAAERGSRQEAPMTAPSVAQAHAFLDAAKMHDAHAVLAALQEYPTLLNMQPGGRWSALMQFASVGDITTALELIKLGANAEAHAGGVTVRSVSAGGCELLFHPGIKEIIQENRLLRDENSALRECTNVQHLPDLSADTTPASRTTVDTNYNSWNLGSWLGSLNFTHEVVHAIESALPSITSDHDGGFGRITHTLTQESLRAALEPSGLQGLHNVVWTAIVQMRQQAAPTGEALSAKFAAEGGMLMQYGDTPVFYQGLEKVIGSPPTGVSLVEAMRREHCEKADSVTSFVANSATTWPKLEWTCVYEPDVTHGYPGQRTPGGENAPEELDRVLHRMAAKNQALSDGGHDQMLKEELIAARIYSGPMYVKLNTVLRFASGNEEYARREDVPPLQAQAGELALGEWSQREGGGRAFGRGRMPTPPPSTVQTRL